MGRIGKFGIAVLSMAFTLFCAAACDTGNGGGNGGEGGVLTEGVFNKTLSVTDKGYFGIDSNQAYARIVEAEDGTLVATGEDFSDTGIPIYRSTDKGRTFTKNEENVNDPTFTGYAFNAKWQPTLYVLPENVGTEMQKGDILLVATSIDLGADNFSRTVLNLYISHDVGLTWEWMSEITRSKNMANSDGNENGCWEGNLYVNAEGELTCIFADETDHKNHSQRIARKTTSDGKNWSELQEVVALENPSLRPGMPSVTKYKDGRYFLTIEMVGENDVPIYWKSSADGIDFGPVTDKGTKISASVSVRDAISGKDFTTTVTLGSSPFCVWTPYGKDANGTIFVTAQRSTYAGARPAGSLMNFFVSYDLGASWTVVDHPVAYDEYNNNRPAYSNSMCISQDGNSMYVVNTVQSIEGSQNNVLTFASVDLRKSLVKAN